MAERKLVLSAEEIAAAPFDFRHPMEPDAAIRIFALSHATGLSQTAVSLAHLEPGRCSYPLHRHHAEEEWVYILSGTATLQLDDESHALGPGSFAAFPAGGPAHKLTNTGGERLVYLMGGDRKPVEVADFPEAGKRLTILKGAEGGVEVSDLDSHRPFDFFARAGEDG